MISGDPCILSVETSTEACSAALYCQGNLTWRYQVAPQQHAKLILKMCNELLAEKNIKPAQLSAIAFGQGPGSFTGVRIAAAVTQGIAIAHQLPVIPVSSLQALAQEAYRVLKVEQVCAGIDARMGEVYYSHFKLNNGIMENVSPEKLISKADLDAQASQSGVFCAGSAFQTENILFPTAQALMAIALHKFERHEMGSAETVALPVYLRDNVVF